MQNNIINAIIFNDEIVEHIIKSYLKHLNNKSLRCYLEKNLIKHHLKRIIIFNISIKQYIKQLFYSNTVLKPLINNLKQRLLINNLQIKPP